MTTLAKPAVSSRCNIPARLKKLSLIVRAQALGLPVPVTRSKRSGRRSASPAATPKKATK